jgi:hypothetical protein
MTPYVQLRITICIFIMWLLLFSSPMSAQQFSVHFAGQANYFSKTLDPVINQDGRNFTNTQYIGIKYDHTFKGDQLYLAAYLFRFDGWVGFTVSDPYFGFGTGRGPLYRIGSSIGWNLLKNSRIKLIPNANLIVQWPKNLGYESMGDIDPNMHTPFKGTIYFEGLNTTSILIGPGLDLIYNPWWRINLIFSSYYSFGFVPYAKYFFEYTYDGIRQPLGIWSADGTGFFYSVGVGFKLGKLEKKQVKKKNKRGKKIR